MSARSTRTAEGNAATAVVLEILRVNGLLFAAGSQLAEQERLTAARWQVLGAVALAGRPPARRGAGRSPGEPRSPPFAADRAHRARPPGVRGRRPAADPLDQRALGRADNHGSRGRRGCAA